MLLLQHLDAAILVLEHIVCLTFRVVVYISEKLWFDWNVWQTILELVLGLELILLQLA